MHLYSTIENIFAMIRLRVYHIVFYLQVICMARIFFNSLSNTEKNEISQTNYITDINKSTNKDITMDSFRYRGPCGAHFCYFID